MPTCRTGKPAYDSSFCLWLGKGSVILPHVALSSKMAHSHGWQIGTQWGNLPRAPLLKGFLGSFPRAQFGFPHSKVVHVGQVSFILTCFPQSEAVKLWTFWRLRPESSMALLQPGLRAAQIRRKSWHKGMNTRKYDSLKAINVIIFQFGSLTLVVVPELILPFLTWHLQSSKF